LPHGKNEGSWGFSADLMRAALLAQGVAPRVVMETLGHSQISLTLNTYSHVIPALGRAAAEQMDAMLGPRSADTAAG
jgi:integrase